MKWTELHRQPCSVARALSVVGDRWTLLVLRDFFLGVRRFDHFQERLGVTRHVLANRLRRLVEAGVLERVAYQSRPRRYEYRLTAKGRDLYPVIVGLTSWGDRWMADRRGRPLELVHTACGARATPVLTCPECREPVDARTSRPKFRFAPPPFSETA
ncbi:MAG: helix-turn-helix transcriptional regulator [Gemmatimonadales bacterium]|nr:helix-turn-helix transcriptional regulator [Gemmatimonadales bacterium]